MTHQHKVIGCLPGVVALWRLRQVDCYEFKVNLDYRVSCSLT